MHEFIRPHRKIPKGRCEAIHLARGENVGWPFVLRKFIGFEVRRDYAPPQRLLGGKKRFARFRIDNPMNLARPAMSNVIPTLAPIQGELHDLGELAFKFLRAMALKVAACGIFQCLNAMNEVQRLAVFLVCGRIERPSGAECRKEMSESSLYFLPLHERSSDSLKQYPFAVAALRKWRPVPRIA
jgi:hypothetical protein